MDDDKKVIFLRELTALTRKHGVIISGCGCCGSPRLQDVDVMPIDERAGYACTSDDYECLSWISPDDSWDWENHADDIVR